MRLTRKQGDALEQLETLVTLLHRSKVSFSQVKEILAQAKASRETVQPAKPHSLSASNVEASKQQLGVLIAEIIHQRGLSYEDASKVMLTTRSRVSNVCNGNFAKISLDAMVDFLVNLDQEVTITVTPKPAKKSGTKSDLRTK